VIALFNGLRVATTGLDGDTCNKWYRQLAKAIPEYILVLTPKHDDLKEWFQAMAKAEKSEKMKTG